MHVGLPVGDAQHTTTPILCLQRHAGAKLVGEWSRWDLTRDPKQVWGVRWMAGGSIRWHTGLAFVRMSCAALHLGLHW